MLEVLKKRFEENQNRHPDLVWTLVEQRLKEHPEQLEILKRMEETGGEPDTIGVDENTGKLIFCDCSTETPKGRRSLCYDDEALRKRKQSAFRKRSAPGRRDRCTADDRRTVPQTAGTRTV